MTFKTMDTEMLEGLKKLYNEQGEEKLIDLVFDVFGWPAKDTQDLIQLLNAK